MDGIQSPNAESTKTAFLWLNTTRMKHQSPFTVDGVDITPNMGIRLLGNLVDETPSPATLAT